MNFRISRLNTVFNLNDFNCTNCDLNDFLWNESLDYQKQLLAVTYLIEDKDTSKIVGFYSVLNDRISRKECKTSSQQRKVLKDIPHKKRGYSHFPAVKLGRLGVDSNHENSGLGSKILDFIKINFITNNKTGCRFITVDAYNDPCVIAFYKKNGFVEFPVKEEEKQEDTLLLYFDLLPYSKVSQ